MFHKLLKLAVVGGISIVGGIIGAVAYEAYAGKVCEDACGDGYDPDEDEDCFDFEDECFEDEEAGKPDTAKAAEAAPAEG